MSEQSTEQPVDSAKPEVTPSAEQDTTDWKAEARKWEQRAKENRAAVSEVEKQRKASMNETERAIAEAEERGRTASASQFGQRLARSEFIAAAARRNGAFDATAILEDVNLARYVGDDGEPDAKAIAKAVERLIPANAEVAPPSFDGGARTTLPASVGMNDLMRAALGRT